MREPADACEANGHRLEVDEDVEGEPVSVVCTRPNGCNGVWEVLR